jgi:hypothetical protein
VVDRPEECDAVEAGNEPLAIDPPLPNGALEAVGQHRDEPAMAWRVWYRVLSKHSGLSNVTDQSRHGHSTAGVSVMPASVIWKYR